ncbi:hypothetical protein V8E54_012295 [Elaphomyces granulatus]
MSGANNSSWCSNCKVFRDTDEFEVNKSGKRKKLCRRHSTNLKRKLDKLFDDWQTFETQIRSWSRPGQTQPLEIDCIFNLDNLPISFSSNLLTKEDGKLDRSSLNHAIKQIVELIWESGGFRFRHQWTHWNSDPPLFGYVCSQDVDRAQASISKGKRDASRMERYLCKSKLTLKPSSNDRTLAISLRHTYHAPYDNRQLSSDVLEFVKERCAHSTPADVYRDLQTSQPSGWKTATRQQDFSEMLDQLHASNDLTILLDGWTDVSGHSIYAYMGQTQEGIFVLDICQFKQRPSVDNIKSQLFDILNKLNLPTKQILAVTTDTPQVMEKLRRDISSEHPNILGIKCSLHILNLAVQRALKHQDLLETFKRNQTIVNFFTASHYWLGRLRDWMRDNGVKKGLHIYTPTRWYSAVQVAMSVQGVEEGLIVCLGEGYATQNPLPHKVSTILQSPDHFTKTKALVKLLKPLTDATARLEKLSASLDQIFIAIITCYREVQQTDIELEYQSWKVAVLTAISSLAKRLNHPAYFVALFLNPGWQTMAISQKYNIESITKEILILAKRFGFPKSQCIEIKSDVTDYIVLAQARGNWDGIDLWRWWNQQLRCQQLRLFALKLLQLGVERMKMMAVIRSRIQVQLQEEKRQLAARSFPSNKRARVLNDLEQEEEMEGQADEVEIIEVTSEPEPIRVESGDSSDEEGGSAGEESEDKTLVDVCHKSV